MNWTATQINPFTQEVDQHHIFIEPSIAVIERKIEGHDADDLPNAQLIASAPELLAALRELVQQIQGFQDCNGDKGFVLTEATAAIEKATGGVL